METTTMNLTEQILQDNLDYTLFSWSKQRGINPINIERAEGVYVYDRDGKAYIDFSSQLMSVNIGHGHQAIKEAVIKQMDQVSYVYPGMATEVRGKLGKKLAEITPGDLKRTFFTLGGAEAVENAIKLARIYTGRHKILAQYRSYHGATTTTMSAGCDPRKHPIDSQQSPNFVHFENPYFYRCPWNTNSPQECADMAIKNLEQILQYENPASVAAIIIEGQNGSSGCILYPGDYVKKMREICNKYGILLISDEVMSGFGRTGKMFAIEHHGVVPDMMCMAKGLTSSYLPLGALIVTEKIAAHFNDKALPLGLTYSAHPVSCAAALAAIEVLEKENMVENAANHGEYLQGWAQEMAKKHPSIGDYRSTGLLGCLELVKNRTSKEPLTPWNASPEKSEPTNQLIAALREKGMFTFVRWNWLFICPPLSITREELNIGLAIIDQVLDIADSYYTG